MKLDVAIPNPNYIITLNFNDNTICWFQHTKATIEWAGQIAHKVTQMFPNYKLMNLGFVRSAAGGYAVTANWKLNG